MSLTEEQRIAVLNELNELNPGIKLNFGALLSAPKTTPPTPKQQTQTILYNTFTTDSYYISSDSESDEEPPDIQSDDFILIIKGKKYPKVVKYTKKEKWYTVKHKVHIENEENETKQYSRIQDIGRKFSEMFKDLEKASDIESLRIILMEIQQKRYNAFGKISIVDYTTAVHMHEKCIYHILKNKLGYTHEDIPKIINNYAFCGLELTMTLLNPLKTEIKGNINANDRELYKQSLDIFTENKYTFSKKSIKGYTPGLRNPLCEMVQNVDPVSLRLYTIPELINTYVIKKKNIVYLPLSTSDEINDPWSYYIRGAKSNEWIQDSGLCLTSEYLRELFLDKCIQDFRYRYVKKFGHTYSSYYLTDDILSNLIYNIQLLSRPKQFRNLLSVLILKNCTIIPSDEDKFNFLTRNPLEEDDEICVIGDITTERLLCNSIYQIWGNLSGDEIINIYNDMIV
jgi:hypothetical protein